MKTKKNLDVVGVTFKNEDGTDRQEILNSILEDIKEGKEDEIVVVAKTEDTNRYDPNAVAIYLSSPSAAGKVGYISRRYSYRISELIKKGFLKQVDLCSIGRAKDNNQVGLNLTLTFQVDNNDEEEG